MKKEGIFPKVKSIASLYMRKI